MLKRLTRKKQPLPTVAVGGKLPTEEESKVIKEDLKSKKEKYYTENPQKPKIEEAKIEEPPKVRNSITSFNDEYIDLAKAYLKIPKDKTNVVLDFAKAIIKLVSDNNRLVSELKKYSLNNYTPKQLRSSENSASWN